MNYTELLIFVFLGFCLPTSCLRRYFHYVNLTLTWSGARQYCKEKYTDLASIRSMEDIRMLERPALDTPDAWIGLSDDPESWKKTTRNDANSWKWSATGEMSSSRYTVWLSGEPNNGYLQFCGMMYHDGSWTDEACEDFRSFVCVAGTAVNMKTFVYVPTALRWADARDYCRKNYTDLAVIENSSENTQVYQVKPRSVSVWIGLYRTPWTWTDGSNSLFRNWQSGQPDNSNLREFCAAENAQHEWSDLDCKVQNTFVCHEDLKGMVVKMKFQTSADMTDPAIESQFIQQLGALLKRRGLMDIKLQWKIQPRKQENDQEELPGAQCT